MDSFEELIPANYLNLIAQAARDLGSIDVDFLNANSKDYVTFSELKQTLISLAVKVNKPEFSFEIGKRLTMETHGFMGYAAKSSRTVEDALHINVKYLRTRLPFVSFELLLENDLVALEVNIGEELKAFEAFLMELLLTCFQATAHQAFPGANFCSWVELKYPEPQYQSLYDKYLGVPVRFSQHHNRIVGRKSNLELPLPDADPSLFALAENECIKQSQFFSNLKPVSEQVCHVLRSDLIEPMSQPDIAATLNISERTLKNRLAKEGSSYRQLLLDLRMDLATYYLRQEQISIKEIAYRLGYSEPANFTLAFKKHEGKSPKEYRADAKIGI